DLNSPGAMWQPIVVTSLIFASFHIGYGPDPVPIFLFSLALGYLYFKTHRILPCIITHMALNALSMLILWNEIGSSK
ncbi:MAG: CPBP family intramembrane metalloprotease, partial [Planctomycetales bacterium]